ncbi:hypothetical protein [Nocardia sp. SSK8]|uniref:hypothetical protein n=1 Tax=Nocardia sp. SSK8 TaxID=3120154 RepID=UPI00300818F1
MHRTSEQSESQGSPHPYWITVQTARTVLIVVHTMTAWNRLSDILPVFDSDRRIQLIFTFPDVSKVTGDVEEQLRTSGAQTIPWERALTDNFDLAISVHHSGDLHRISAPLAVLSHGVGYSKIARESRIENRESRIENRESRIENVYGLGREWLVRDGRVPDAVVLAHVADRQRLARTAPEALPHTVIAGDPCFDRMQASRHLRPAYRVALGAAGRTVVTVSSTWGPQSLLGRHPDLIDDLLSELPLDDYLVTAILHPNVWFAHGPWQIRTWLADALRSGLRLIPPISGWQQAVLAADLMIGDHGAVTTYAAAHEVPTMLASFPRDEVATGSAADLLGELAPRLDPGLPLPDQIGRAITTYDRTRMRAVRALATSHPGACLDTLRATFYRLLCLPEPGRPAPEFPYPAEALAPHDDPVQACRVTCEWHEDPEDGPTARLRRWPADVTPRRNRGHRATESCLVVHAAHPRRDLNGNADAVVVPVRPGIDTDEVLRQQLRDRPGCGIAVAEVDPGRLRLLRRDGLLVEAVIPGSAHGPMVPAVIAAAVHTGPEKSRVGDRPMTLLIGDRRISVDLKEIDTGSH